MLKVMFGQNVMPGDKMVKLFIIQAISAFVSGDHASGLHYLNEIKMSYAEYQSSLNPTLKNLAKEIIQSLDMFTPGSSADQYAETNIEAPALTPQQEMATAFAQNSQNQSQPVNTQQQAAQPSGAQPAGSTITSDLQDLLNRRRARRKK